MSTCFIHSAAGFVAYVCFLAAGLGSGTYVLVQRYSALRQLENFRQTMQEFRGKLNLTYLAVGFILLTVSIVLGVLNAKSAWGAWWSWDAKELFSVFLWLYYGVTVVFGFLGAYRGSSRAAGVAAILALAGLVLLALNVVAVNFYLSSRHTYL